MNKKWRKLSRILIDVIVIAGVVLVFWRFGLNRDSSKENLASIDGRSAATSLVRGSKIDFPIVKKMSPVEKTALPEEILKMIDSKKYSIRDIDSKKVEYSDGQKGYWLAYTIPDTSSAEAQQALMETILGSDQERNVWTLNQGIKNEEAALLELTLISDLKVKNRIIIFQQGNDAHVILQTVGVL